MSDKILPSNATKLEVLTAKALDKVELVPIPIRSIYNADLCPANLLPYLAWSRSVDRWDPEWSTETKRKVIKASFSVHKKKGTIGSLKRVIEPLGYIIRISEWWEYNGVPGTFKLDIGVLDTGITDETYLEMERLISDAKPVSKHLLSLTIKAEVKGICHVASAVMSGVSTTIYPYVAEDTTIKSESFIAASMIMNDAVTVYPKI